MKLIWQSQIARSNEVKSSKPFISHIICRTPGMCPYRILWSVLSAVSLLTGMFSGRGCNMPFECYSFQSDINITSWFAVFYIIQLHIKIYWNQYHMIGHLIKLCLSQLKCFVGTDVPCQCIILNHIWVLWLKFIWRIVAMGKHMKMCKCK